MVQECTEGELDAMLAEQRPCHYAIANGHHVLWVPKHVPCFFEQSTGRLVVEVGHNARCGPPHHFSLHLHVQPATPAHSSPMFLLQCVPACSHEIRQPIGGPDNVFVKWFGALSLAVLQRCRAGAAAQSAQSAAGGAGGGRGGGAA